MFNNKLNVKSTGLSFFIFFLSLALLLFFFLADLCTSLNFKAEQMRNIKDQKNDID